MEKTSTISCNPSQEAGVSMIFVSLLLILSGIALFAKMPLKNDRLETELSEVNEKLVTVKKALNEYYKENGSLPCPARLDLTSENSGFGKSDCVTNSAGKLYRQGTVRIGAVPTRSLTLPDHLMYDDWGNLITYVMDSNFPAAPLNIRNLQDTKTITDENNKPPVAALISHGEDGVGAYSRSGNLSRPCSLASAIVEQSELENCNFSGDTKFISGLGNNTQANFFDDITEVVYQKDFNFTCPRGVKGCTLWLDAADSSTITKNGTLISQWRDKSGNNNNAVQALFLLQPEYKSNINSIGTVSFNGLTHIMSSSMTTPDFPYTIIAVYKSSGLVGMIAGFNKTLGLSPQEGLRKNGSNRVSLIQQNNALIGGTRISLDADAPAANAHIAIGIFSGNNNSFKGELYLNGTSMGSGTSTTRSPESRNFAIGGLILLSTYMAGDVGEILIYPRALSNTELEKINCYLSVKWNIAVSATCP